MTDASFHDMKRLCALVADDEPLMLGLVTGVIERLDVDVLCASNGDELLEHIADHGPFDVIVTDVAMPWMTGLHVMHSIRAAGETTPVVVITALTDSRIDVQVRSLGAHSILLHKPFSLGALYHALEHVTGLGVMGGPRAHPP